MFGWCLRFVGKAVSALSLRSWFKRMTGKRFGRRLARSIAPRRRARPQPAVRPAVNALEDRYAPAILAALGQMKEMCLGIKVADAALEELTRLQELQSLGLSRILTQRGLKALDALKTPAISQTAPSPEGDSRQRRVRLGRQLEKVDGPPATALPTARRSPRAAYTWCPPRHRLTSR